IVQAYSPWLANWSTGNSTKTEVRIERPDSALSSSQNIDPPKEHKKESESKDVVEVNNGKNPALICRLVKQSPRHEISEPFENPEFEGSLREWRQREEVR